MKLIPAAAAALIAGAVLATPVLAREDMDADLFIKKWDTNKDGMISKAEMMKAMETMFEKQDTTRRGMLEKKQFELFLKELMKSGG